MDVSNAVRRQDHVRFGYSCIGHGGNTNISLNFTFLAVRHVSKISTYCLMKVVYWANVDYEQGEIYVECWWPFCAVVVKIIQLLFT